MVLLPASLTWNYIFFTAASSKISIMCCNASFNHRFFALERLIFTPHIFCLPRVMLGDRDVQYYYRLFS